MKTETLAQDVGWEASGHLSEVALSAAADGEEALLDAEMQGHLGACEGCATRLGHVALRSAGLGDLLALAASRTEEKAAPVIVVPSAPISRARRKAPIFAVAAALAIALVGAAPALQGTSREAMHTWMVLRKVAPSFVRLLPQALGRAWTAPSGPLSTIEWCMAIGLALAGFAIARKASKKALVNGEQR